MSARHPCALLSLLLAACAARGGPSEPDPATLAPGDHDITIEVGGRERWYRVHVPPSNQLGGRPALLLAFHGGGGNPAQFQGTAGLDAIADREGLLVVYPAGSGDLAGVLTWNAGPGCCGYARDRNVDDVAFFEGLLDDLATRQAFDAGRVYVTGHSNGSMMAYRIAAVAPARIAAVVGVAGTMQLPTVRPSQPVPVLHIHSRDDPRAFYEGGTRADREHAPVADMLASWRDINGCGPDPTEVARVEGADGGPDAGHTATLLRWSCTRAPLEHWRLTGAGHAWPGNRVGALRETILGPSTEVIRAADEIWKFISAL